MADKEIYYVQRRIPEAVRKHERYRAADSLYETGVRVEGDGTILFPKWVTVESGSVDPETFTSLSGRKMPDSFLMRKGLVSKIVKERTIAEIKKDGGSVETAIRAVGHVIEQENEVEKEQADLILKRSSYLLRYFEEHRLSSIPPEERERLEEETLAMLADMGLDSEQIRLPVKRMSVMWTIKGSGGKDSLDRDNELIALQSLWAARRSAMKRKQAIEGPILLTYSQWEGALILAGASDRQVLQEVGEETENRLMRNIYIEGREQRVAGDYEYLIDKVGNLSWNLEETLVKPYRTLALEGKKSLEELEHLLVEGKRDPGRRQEIRSSGLLQDMMRLMSLDPEVGEFGRVLNENQEIYSGQLG